MEEDESQNRRKEFCRKYDISSTTYINKLKIMTKEELAEEIKENKIFYNNQYISAKKYCKLNGLNYETLASKAQREKKTIKEMLLNASI